MEYFHKIKYDDLINFFLIFYSFNSALIFVSHGVGEHCSRYEEFGHLLARQGFLVVSHDHGKCFKYTPLIDM